jgi:hypothetical protein
MLRDLVKKTRVHEERNFMAVKAGDPVAGHELEEFW